MKPREAKVTTGGTLNLKPETRNQKPKTVNPKPQTPNPKPQTPTPKPQTPNPKPQTLNPRLRQRTLRHDDDAGARRSKRMSLRTRQFFGESINALKLEDHEQHEADLGVRRALAQVFRRAWKRALLYVKERRKEPYYTNKSAENEPYYAYKSAGKEPLHTY